MNTPIYETELAPEERRARARAKRKARKIALALGFYETGDEGFWRNSNLCPVTRFYLTGPLPITSAEDLIAIVFSQGLETGRDRQMSAMREAIGL